MENKINKAYKLFYDNKYAQALDLFNDLVNKYGKENFENNIILCKKKIFNQSMVLSILDNISELSFQYELLLKRLDKNNYKNQILSYDVPILIESCWEGNECDWIYAFISKINKNHLILKEALILAKKNNRKIIFWNKEDPFHYDDFKHIYPMCDYIFTTDSNMIVKYRKDFPDIPINLCMFAAQTKLCNPIDRNKNQQLNICFAGSYYRYNHEDRKKQMDDLLPALIELKGDIYDRMYNRNNERYFFPDKYKKIIKGGVPFYKMFDIYKKYKLFININTVTNSDTMMSRRVYELLACGTVVLSSNSKAMEKQFDGIVPIVSNAKDCVKTAQDLLNDDLKLSKLSHLGYREVHSKHSYKKRVKEIKNIVFNYIENSYNPLVSIILCTMRPNMIERIVENIKYQSYKNLELIAICQDYSYDDVLLLENKLHTFIPNNNIKIYISGRYESLGGKTNQAIEEAKGEFIAKMDDDDFYFKNYISDMLLTFDFGRHDVAGKKERFIYFKYEDNTYLQYVGQKHRYTNFITGASIFAKKDIFNYVKFGEINKGEDSIFLNQLNEKKIRIYASDPYNYCIFRSNDKKFHTWQEGDVLLKRQSLLIGKGLCKNVIEI